MLLPLSDQDTKPTQAQTYELYQQMLTCSHFGNNLIIIFAVEGWSTTEQDKQHHSS